MKVHTFVCFVLFIAVACQTKAEEKPKALALTTNKPAVAASVAATNDSPVARVNGAEISRKELDASVRALTMQMARRGQPSLSASSSQLQLEVLDELIGRELILQEGSKHPGADIEQKTQAQIEAVKKQLGGEEQYKSTLAETGITPDEYAKRVRNNVIIQETMQELSAQAKVTPEEVKAYYDKYPDQFKQAETVRASHILIRVPPGATDDVKKQKRAQIDAARSLVKGGEKFADVATKVSEDPGSAPNGGDLGFFPRGAMVPEFDAAAFSLATNSVSDVITTQFGYHVLLVTAEPARTLPFDEVKTELTKFLKDRKGGELIRDHVAALRKSAKIEILLPSSSTPAIETHPVSAPAPK